MKNNDKNDNLISKSITPVSSEKVSEDSLHTVRNNLCTQFEKGNDSESRDTNDSSSKGFILFPHGIKVSQNALSAVAKNIANSSKYDDTTYKDLFSCKNDVE